MHTYPAPSASEPVLPLLEQDRAAYVIRDVVLSTRELEIARGVVLGQTNKEIACALSLSQYTVRDHVSALLRKYGARSRTELAVHLSVVIKLQ
jgi:DNA-binding NarL/FixJ family response regulator